MVLHFVAAECANIFYPEINIFLPRIGLNFQIENLPAFASHNGFHGSAHRRSEAHLGAMLVHKQHAACLDMLALANNNFWSKPWKIIG